MNINIMLKYKKISLLMAESQNKSLNRPSAIAQFHAVLS